MVGIGALGQLEKLGSQLLQDLLPLLCAAMLDTGLQDARPDWRGSQTLQAAGILHEQIERLQSSAFSELNISSMRTSGNRVLWSEQC